MMAMATMTSTSEKARSAVHRNGAPPLDAANRLDWVSSPATERTELVSVLGALFWGCGFRSRIAREIFVRTGDLPACPRAAPSWLDLFVCMCSQVPTIGVLIGKLAGAHEAGDPQTQGIP